MTEYRLKKGTKEGTNGLAGAIREAIGATPTEEVIVKTPQFEREPGAPIPSTSPTDWEALREMDSVALREMGCRAWDEPTNGKVLMLFPGEWYESIPNGYNIIGISGTPEKFTRGVTGDDIRFGMLAFGIEVAEGKRTMQGEGK